MRCHRFRSVYHVTPGDRELVLLFSKKCSAACLPLPASHPAQLFRHSFNMSVALVTHNSCPLPANLAEVSSVNNFTREKNHIMAHKTNERWKICLGMRTCRSTGQLFRCSVILLDTSTSVGLFFLVEFLLPLAGPLST